jgi:hypothetical protein
MNNLPDEDPQLTNFLRQHRSIAPPPLPDLEDRVMAEIDLLPIVTKQRSSRSWWRYIVGGIGIIATVIVGGSIHQIISPPEPSLAEIQQLNLYLEAHARDLVVSPDQTEESHDRLLDSDGDIFADSEPEDS